MGVIKGLVIIAGFIYIIFSVIAYLNVKDADSKNKYIFPTWFLQKDIFNGYGKRLCLIGFILFIMVFGGSAFLFFSE